MSDHKKLIDQLSPRRLTRILWGSFIVVLSLALLTAYLTLSDFKHVTKRLDTIVKLKSQKVILAFNMRDAIRLRQTSISNMLASNDLFEKDNELLRFYNYASMYRVARTKIMALPADESEKRIYKLLTEKTKIAQPINVLAAEYLLDEHADFAKMREKVNNALAHQKDLIDLLNVLIEELQKQSEEALADTQKSYGDAQNLSITLNSIMVLLGLVVTVVVTRYVHRNSVMLNNALVQANMAAESKAEFLANMSHEIRTPMNGVLGMLHLLRDSYLDSNQKEMTVVAYNSANSLLTIINDILDFSKIEAGKLTFEIIDYSLHDLIEEVVDLYQKNCKDKSIVLFCDISPQLTELIKGDPTRVRQILTNLIDNAIKFTEIGEIKVSLEILSQFKMDIELKISVTDSGIGIAKHKQLEIFESFSQADGSTTRKYGGTGLGLTICKQLALLANGDIGVESQEGCGSTFWFTKKTQITENSNIFEADPKIKGCSIILYFPNSSILNVVSKTLRHWGAKVQGYSNQDEFIGDFPVNKKTDFIIFDEQAIPLLECIDINTSINMICVGINRYQNTYVINEKVCDYINYHIKRNVLHQVLLDSFDNVVKVKQEILIKIDKPLNILLVDDVDVNLIVAQSYLKKVNLSADTAVNGEDAVEKSSNKRYDLIFMDCQMPLLNGYDATLAIRKYEIQHNKPRCVIIAMTANVMKEDREKCLQADMDDFLPKPVEIEKMVEKIQLWTNSKLVHVLNDDVQLIKNNQPINSFENEKNNIRLDEITQGLDYKESERLLNIFKNDCSDKIIKLKNIELDKIIKSDQAAIQIHSLKGSAANLGFNSLSELCKSIEHALSIENLVQLPYLFNKLDVEINNTNFWIDQYIESKKTKKI